MFVLQSHLLVFIFENKSYAIQGVRRNIFVLMNVNETISANIIVIITIIGQWNVIAAFSENAGELKIPKDYTSLKVSKKKLKRVCSVPRFPNYMNRFVYNINLLLFTVLQQWKYLVLTSTNETCVPHSAHICINVRQFCSFSRQLFLVYFCFHEIINH